MQAMSYGGACMLYNYAMQSRCYSVTTVTLIQAEFHKYSCTNTEYQYLGHGGITDRLTNYRMGILLQNVKCNLDFVL